MHEHLILFLVALLVNPVFHGFEQVAIYRKNTARWWWLRYDSKRWAQVDSSHFIRWFMMWPSSVFLGVVGYRAFLAGWFMGVDWYWFLLWFLLGHWFLYNLIIHRWAVTTPDRSVLQCFPLYEWYWITWGGGKI